MALAVGTRIGSYHVVAPLGAGGMGEVYRARDTKLDREVALKVLPADVATDPERLARFEREARTLASLNHPNIAQVFGLEDSTVPDGPVIRALAMELVEGDDLSVTIARGPLPVDEVRPIARQIAEALEAAHDAGIVHRDLKPANIKIRADGAVKVLDFGLAKALDAATGDAAREAASALTSPVMTRAGVIMGTAAYMAPEQAKGRTVDRRADIWAFGCVLYELLTGHRAFAGEDVSETITAVLRDAPDWSRLPGATPPDIRTLLVRCLEKDPRQRLRDIGEARVVLERPAATPDPLGTSPVVRPGRRWQTATILAAVAVAAAAGGAAAGFAWRRAPEPRLQRFHVAVQGDARMIAWPFISPDGRTVVYSSRARLWVQSLDEWTPRELPGTDSGVNPFWSPASDWIGFFRSEKLLKVPVQGGPVVAIASLPAVQAPLANTSAVWQADGTIVLSLAEGPLYEVPSSGGDLKEFLRIPADVGDDLHDLSALSAGTFVAAVHRRTGLDAIGVVADGRVTVVAEAPNVRHPVYVPPGHLLYERRDTQPGIWAVPFAVGTRAVTGEAFLVDRGTDLSAARDGTLSFLGQHGDLARHVAWFTLDGRIESVVATPQPWTEGLSISPDGRRVLASATDGIWAYDTATGSRSRITSGPADISPRWIGASGRVAFVRNAGTGPAVVMKRAEAGAEEQVVATSARFPSATTDGRVLVFNARAKGARAWTVAWIEVDRPTEVRHLGPAHVGARFPCVSPDGRLVLYVSGETGRDEVFVTRFPSGTGKWQASTEGGGWAWFSPRGDALFYRALSGDFMRVPVAPGDDVTLGPPQRLFAWGDGWLPPYDISSDGRRGLATVPARQMPEVARLSIVQHWHAPFARR